MREKYYCEWCHMMSFDDDRGGCSRCGGGRKVVEEKEPIRPTWYGQPYYLEPTTGSSVTLVPGFSYTVTTGMTNTLGYTYGRLTYTGV